VDGKPMNFDTLMRRGWKPELPSDTLLRENPAAYDASPVPFMERFPKAAHERRTIRECAVCEEMKRITRHHLIPAEYWQNGPCVWVCDACHTNVHFFFTNEQLCETDWNDVIAEVRKHTLYAT
jgi:hypothetical protein